MLCRLSVQIDHLLGVDLEIGRRKSPLAGSGLNVVAHRRGVPKPVRESFIFMMLVIFFIVIIVWAVGLITAYTLGGLIHLLLLLALIILLIEFLERRKVL